MLEFELNDLTLLEQTELLELLIFSNKLNCFCVTIEGGNIFV